jgi:hypothetical protein
MIKKLAALIQKRSTIPICTNLIGYHSATECQSYDRPKIRQKPTFIKSAFAGF